MKIFAALFAVVCAVALPAQESAKERQPKRPDQVRERGADSHRGARGGALDRVQVEAIRARLRERLQALRDDGGPRTRGRQDDEQGGERMRRPHGEHRQVPSRGRAERAERPATSRDRGLPHQGHRGSHRPVGPVLRERLRERLQALRERLSQRGHRGQSGGRDVEPRRLRRAASQVD